jgi:hypothetical protein
MVMTLRTKAQIVSRWTGIYARVARKLNVDPSLVSRVVSGERKSQAIDAALHEELEAIKKLLADY